jgi:DNA-binding response OmpR family regulator
MTAGKILIVDDDVRLAGMLVELLAGEGFEPAHALSRAVGLGRLSRHSFDLVILDVVRGKKDGLELLRCLQRHIPVLMLTAREDEEDGILGLELGADDYLSKPFRARELVARLRAILRRPYVRRWMEWTPLKLGELAIDPEARSATMEGVPVRLTTAEFLVLEALARSAGRVQSRATLTYQALGRRLEPFDRSIDTHISNIRRKLCLDPGRGIEIKSVRGHGYVLTVPRSGLEKHLRPAPEPCARNLGLGRDSVG